MSNRFGASFSPKYCRELGIHPQDCLQDALEDMGVRRLRLMSYWDEIEKSRGTYDFDELDWQFDMAEKHGAKITLCLGLRQPRWPESHWPAWAKELSTAEWQPALLEFIETVVRRYKSRTCLISYQLENEARLKKFGQNGDFDRSRLKAEYRLVKSIDPIHPVLMSVSDSWGIPVFGPIPDSFGFSIYRYFYDRGEYRRSTRPPFFFMIQALLIRILKWRRVFIHELQAEPWGPRATVDMSLQEQLETMSIDRLREAVDYARKTHLSPIDIWGLEWWFYLKAKHNHQMVWNYFQTVYRTEK